MTDPERTIPDAVDRPFLGHLADHPDSFGWEPELIDAYKFALAAHAGQTDKQGRDYFAYHLHPVASLAMRLAQVMLPDRVQQVGVVAFLHDCGEDQGVTRGDLERARFSPAVIDAAVTLWHTDKGISRDDYIIECMDDPIDAIVKLADDLYNSDPFNLVALPDDDVIRLCGKYRADRAVMAGAWPFMIAARCADGEAR